MVSIKEYASSKNVSYEAVRKQINRYKKELTNHIQKVGRTQYLDDFAVDFLNEKRQSNPVVILETSKEEELEQLRLENKSLLLKVAELQELLLKEKDSVKTLQEEKIALLEEKNSSQTKTKWYQKFFN